MALDYTKLLKKINPQDDGQDVLRLRVGVVAAIASDGTVDVTINGVTVPDVPVLGGAYFAVASTVQILSYRGSLLIIGSAGPAAAVPVQALAANADSGSTASTGGTNTLTTTGIHGVAFIAPPSGSVMVIVRASGFNDTAGGYTLLDFEVKTGATVGSGSIVRGASDVSSSSIQHGVANRFGSHVSTGLVAGLTPGAAYNAALVYKISGGANSSWNRRYVQVLPQ